MIISLQDMITRSRRQLIRGDSFGEGSYLQELKSVLKTEFCTQGIQSQESSLPQTSTKVN